MAGRKKTEQITTKITGSPNPFLQSREKRGDINQTRTGYRIRTDYVDVLSVLKTLKKGYTLEAILDEILTFYFENAEDGQKAIEKAAVLYS